MKSRRVEKSKEVEWRKSEKLAPTGEVFAVIQDLEGKKDRRCSRDPLAAESSIINSINKNEAQSLPLLPDRIRSSEAAARATVE